MEKSTERRIRKELGQRLEGVAKTGHCCASSEQTEMLKTNSAIVFEVRLPTSFRKSAKVCVLCLLHFFLLIYSFKEYYGRAWTRPKPENFQKISLRPGRWVFLFSFHKLFQILDKIISLFFSSTSIQVLRKHLFRFPGPLLQLLLYSSSLGLQQQCYKFVNLLQ